MKDRPHNGQMKTGRRIRGVWRYQRAVIRSRKSMTDRPHNGQKKTGRRIRGVW
jgi:hypothetical protein